jgi:hypothetical protein
MTAHSTSSATPAARCSRPGASISWSSPSTPGTRFRISARLSAPLTREVTSSAGPTHALVTVDRSPRHSTKPAAGSNAKTTAPAIRWIVDEVSPGVPGRLVGNTAAATSATAQPVSSSRTIVAPAAKARPRAMASPASANAPVATANSGSPNGVVTT